MKKYVDIDQFYKDQIKAFKCVPLVGSSDNDSVSLREIVEEVSGIYMSDEINEAFTKEKFLNLLYSYWSVNSHSKHSCCSHLL